MKSKKQLGMYTLTLNDDGSLQIQAPTLLRPLSIEARQVQELQHWLNINQPEYAASAGTTPAAVAPVVSTSSASTVPVQPENINEPPEIVAQRTIQELVANASSRFPESLAPENRDRFIEQVTRNPVIRPLMSQGKISYKQVTLLIEKQLGTGLY